MGVAAEGALEAFTGIPSILTVGSLTKPPEVPAAPVPVGPPHIVLI